MSAPRPMHVYTAQLAFPQTNARLTVFQISFTRIPYQTPSRVATWPVAKDAAGMPRKSDLG